jgi:hypothetical protein
MDGIGPPHSLSDAQLDRELEAALGVEPSPEFLARVRTRVAGEPGMVLWRLAMQRWSFEPLIGVAVIGIVLTIVVPRLMRDDQVRRPPAAVTAAQDANLRIERQAPIEEAAEPVSEAGSSLRVRSRTTGVNELPLRLSQPLFSDDDRRALVQFISAAEEGRLPAMSAEATDADVRRSASPDLRIEPLVIDPLPLLARVQVEGEAKW